MGKHTPRLTFARNRQVWWDGDIFAGTIEPMLKGDGKWGYIPDPSGPVPNALRTQIQRNTQREIKSWLRQKLRATGA